MKKLILILVLTLFSFNLGAVDIIIWKEDETTITLDRFTVQKIFTKKITRWPNGKSIVVFIKPLSSIEHRDFVLNTLGMSPYYFREQLEEQTFSGKASSVTEIANDQQMLMKIEQTPGGIGYVNYTIHFESKEIIIIDIAAQK